MAAPTPDCGLRTADCVFGKATPPAFQATSPIRGGIPPTAYLSNLLKSKSLPLASLPSVALLVTRILMVWIMMMKSSKMS